MWCLTFKFLELVVMKLTTTTVLRPLHRSTCMSWHLQLRTGGFFDAQFYCPHALADGNQRIQIREKTLEFSSTVIYTVSVVDSEINLCNNAYKLLCIHSCCICM